jgi:hypothetical protein
VLSFCSHVERVLRKIFGSRSTNKMFSVYLYIRSYFSYYWHPKVEESIEKAKSEKWKIIKGKRYRAHPFSHFYTVFPEYEVWQPKQKKVQIPVVNSDNFTQQVSYRKGGVSFSVDLDWVAAVEYSDFPRRFLSTDLWNCISRPQVFYGFNSFLIWSTNTLVEYRLWCQFGIFFFQVEEKEVSFFILLIINP